MINLIYKLSVFLLLFFSLHLTLQAKEATFIIGFPEDNMSNDWRAAQMKEIQQSLKKHKNVRFLMADAAGSVAQNILDIEDMVAQGVQLLFLAPKNPKVITPIVKKLRKKGIYIILLTRKLLSEDYDVFISPDDFMIAYKAGTLLANTLNGTGRILMIEGVASTTTAIRRKKGFLASLENYPNIKVISKQGNYSRAGAIKVIESTLNKRIKFNAIYAHNDAMAAGARLALKKAGINPASIPTIGIDFLPETRKAIINGEQLASFTYPTCGKIGVDSALKLLSNKKVPRYISVASQRVTKNNVLKVNTIY